MMKIKNSFVIWRINNYVLLLISFSAIFWQGFTSSLVSIREGCGNDGAHYCAMVGNSPLPNLPNTPYSQRVLLPFLIKLIFNPKSVGDTINAFALFNGILIAGSSLLIFLIVKKYAQENYLPVISVILFYLHPFTFRLTLTYPVLTDQLSYFLIFLIIYLLQRNQITFDILILFFSGCLLLTRLHQGVILLVVLFFYYLKLSRFKKINLISIPIILFLGLYIALSAKYFGSSNPDFIEMFISDIYSSLTDLYFLGRMLLLVFVGLGTYSIFTLFFLKEITREPVFLIILIISFLNLLASLTFGAGGDTDRYLAFSGFLLLILIFSLYEKKYKNQIWIIPSFYSAILLWEPFMYKFEDELRFEFMFARRWTEPIVVLDRSMNVIILSFILLILSLFLKRKRI